MRRSQENRTLSAEKRDFFIDISIQIENVSAGTEIFQSGICNEIPRGAGYYIAAFSELLSKDSFPEEYVRMI